MAISNLTQGLRPGICTSTTRPTTPYEGQLIYTTDLDTLEIWNGSAWRILGLGTPASGSVLQVVSSSYSTETSSTSASWVTTGLNASITPKSTSSKILAIASVAAENENNTNGSAFSLFRGTVSGTNLGHSTQGFGSLYNGSSRVLASISFNYLDSPSTTSAQIYTVGMYAASGAKIYAQRFSGVSTLTLMEIAA
jgi:hypothetical protein